MGSAVQNKSLNETLTREISIAMAMGVVMIALVLCATTTSWFEPFLFLMIMGIAIIINMGTNLMMIGTISFITFSVWLLSCSWQLPWIIRFSFWTVLQRSGKKETIR